MAVQFNLLPDIKLEFNRQQRLKRLIYSVSILAILISVGLMVLSFITVDLLQKQLISNANKDIKTYTDKLKAIPNLDKVLTIQNQLAALPALHQQKHITSRLFDYLPQVTPVKVNIGKLALDNAAGTFQIDGTADTVQSVNKFVDTLKFTTYTTGGNSEKKKAFSDVKLTKIDRDEKEATYTINLSFDPALFSSAQDVALIVPQETTTRSVINSPDANSVLFNGQTAQPKKDTQGSQ
jgi:Tfp pilus assembly protein PilN